MACLEFISYSPVWAELPSNSLQWERDRMAAPILGLPQLYWKEGTPWSEANHWVLTKVRGTEGNDLKTSVSLLKHLTNYASWLEYHELDWRHFPQRAADRPIFQYRAELLRQRDVLGVLKPSTTSSRMAAVIAFYRHAQAHGFVHRDSPMWEDRQVLRMFENDVGLKRTLLLKSSKLAIPNRARHGDILEDGLTPLRAEHANELLAFTQRKGMLELNLMLSLGFMSGGRFGTIQSLEVRHIENAIPDESMEGICLVAVGPGTGVKTKFDVSGSILMPTFLVEALKSYAYSMRRLRRQAKASHQNRGRLFLTARGNPYSQGTFTALMTVLRRHALDAGLKFMQCFKFHQSRVTFGSMLMAIALDAAPPSAAIAFVCKYMLHKKEAMTMRYVKFIEQAPVKARVSDAFSTLFSGVAGRDWNKFIA